MPMNSNVFIVNVGVMVRQIATTNQMSKDGGYYDIEPRRDKNSKWV